MRSLGLTIVFGVLAAAAPVLAQPPSLMSRLDKYCVATKGNGEAARRAARADGFVTPPMELIPNLPRNIGDMEVSWDVFDGGVVMLLTGTANDPSVGMKGDFCAVATMPQNTAAVRELEGWLGAKLPGRDGYLMFADEPGGRKIIRQDDTRALLTAVRDERLRMAGAKTEDKMTLLMLVVLRL